MAKPQETDYPYMHITGLCKHYGEGDARLEVLKGINVSIEKGEICVLLGPSGSGKSTFLNIIGGLESADSGSARIAGTDLVRLNNRQLGEYRRRELGFVFQFYNLVGDLTVRENIEVCKHISSNPLDLDELLESLGLWEHRNKFPSQISGGQQQRCAIGRALVKNPGLLLCDEPTGALDYKTGKQVLALLQDTCRRTGRTVIVITHNTALTAMADRIIQVRSGKIVSNQVNEHPVPVQEIEW